MKVLIAVIAFNEEESIREVLQDLQDSGCSYDVIVIDDGSTDETGSLCREFGVIPITHCVNTKNPFQCVKTYFTYACRNDYDIVCQFDGDGQHIVSELEKIIAPIKIGKADFVIGSRFIENRGFQSNWIRRIGINLFSLIDTMLTGVEITDSTSGFRAYGRVPIKFMGHRYPHEIFDTSQVLLLSHYAGARIVEVPVEMRQRLKGKSEFDFFRSVTFVVKGMLNIVGCRLQKGRLRTFIGGSKT